MIDSAFSTVKWRAMDTGIKRRKALKSVASEWRIEANDMLDAYKSQKVRSSNHDAREPSSAWFDLPLSRSPSRME